MAKIFMDGKTYRVRIIRDSTVETAKLEDGINAGKMLSGMKERDLEGTYYGHSMSVEPDPRYPEDYDQFFEDISAPVPYHTITMPHGQGAITYDAMVYSASRVNKGKQAGVRRWAGITVTFEPLRPQRVPAKPGVPG